MSGLPVSAPSLVTHLPRKCGRDHALASPVQSFPLTQFYLCPRLGFLDQPQAWGELPSNPVRLSEGPAHQARLGILAVPQ